MQRKATAMEAAADYLVHVAQIKYDRGEPVLLYGHPTGEAGGCSQVGRQIFDWAAGRQALWRTSLGELNDWWRARAKVQISVTWQDGAYAVQVSGLGPTYSVGIEFCRGNQVAVLPLDRPVVQCSSEALAYEERTAEPIVAPIQIEQPGGLRAQVRRLLDWEYDTPVDEIPTNTWRNWAKRSLRRWWKR